MSGLLLKGFLLGWSVAWPPGPINAEMIRRGLARGFWPAFSMGLGASTGDFCWAVAVSFGAGALANVPGLKLALGIVSCGLLFVLAALFSKGAWHGWKAARAGTPPPPPKSMDSARGGFLLGMTLALSGPWNLAFWLAVIGQQQASGSAQGITASLTMAVAVVAGAITWCFVLNGAVKLGARFATPAWEIVTSAGTAALMVYFGVRLALHLAAGGTF